jgi:hypothetical protein
VAAVSAKRDTSASPEVNTPESEPPMNDHSTALKEAMQIEGALGVALVDSNSGMALGTAGSPMDLDLEVGRGGQQQRGAGRSCARWPTSACSRASRTS